MGGSISLSETQSLDVARDLQLAYENLKTDGRSDEDLQREMRDRYLRMMKEMKSKPREELANLGIQQINGMVPVNGDLEESSTLSYFDHVDKIEKSVARPTATPKLTPSPAVSEKTKRNMIKTGRKLTSKVCIRILMLPEFQNVFLARGRADHPPPDEIYRAETQLSRGELKCS